MENVLKNAKGVLKATMFLTKLKIAAMVLMIVGAAGVAAAAEPNDLEWKRSKEGGKSVPERIRSAHSGPWSEPATWEGGKVPGDGTRVQIRAGHTVTYDVHNSIPARIRSIHIAGTL